MGMRVLIIGGGGREHALAWKIFQSRRVSKIYCAPGNPGIAKIAECVPIEPEDIPVLVNFADRFDIDLTVVGPEAPLALGIVDEFKKRSLKIVGPSKKAAQIEGSKVFAKNLMTDLGIPTARYRIANSPEEARKLFRIPCCIKADGLARGKGSISCFTKEDAISAIDEIMIRKKFGAAGDRVVIEEFLAGEEVTFTVFTDGRTIIPMPVTQDHKPVFDKNKGPNTGGMGAYAPAPVVTKELEREIMKTIVRPLIKGLKDKKGIIYQGILYVGLMITSQGPKVLEFNVRFGDPELQPLMMLMESDIVPVLEAISERKLAGIKIRWRKGAAVCVVMASEGYPGNYERGKEIKGLEKVAKMKNVVVFHAGTQDKNGKILTNGGRVIGVTGYSEGGIAPARELAYEAVSKIEWEGVHYRKDIGLKAIERERKR